MVSRGMILAVLIVAIIFGSALIGLSMRANTRYRHEKRLPMQWSLSRSKPPSETIIWSAPRLLALSFTPFLAVCTLVLFSMGAMALTPRPGQEWLMIPALSFIGGVFVAAHAFHIWMIEKTLKRGGY